MAESADALVSGTSGSDIVEVQVPFGSPLVYNTIGVLIKLKNASVAQSVEQGTENPRVSGSIPL